MKKSIIVVMALSAGVASAAESYSRANRWEAYGYGSYLSGADSTKSGSVKIELGKGFAGGAGFGYNFSDYLNLNTTIGVGTIDIKGSSPGTSIEIDSTIFTMDVGLDYNILKKPLTPFITGGVGFIHFGGDIGGSNATISETDLTYGVGGGLRWDINERWFLKAMYRANWTSLQDTDGTSMYHSFTLGVGVKF